MRDPAPARSGRFGRFAALAVLSAAVVAGGSGLPALAAPAAVATASRAAAVTRNVLLITGDELAVRSQGPRRLIADRSPSTHDPMLSLRSGSMITETPVAALPYLGRGLSPALFQLAALEKAEPHGRLPVRVSYTGKRPAIPGLTFTHTSTGSADGYLTAASARAFGAALVRQYTTDHATGRYGTDGLFGHDVSITPIVSGAVAAARAKPVTARPGYQMHTLTVHATNLAGKADTGDYIEVFNADNFGKFTGLDANYSVFYGGAARFSMPAGHYWAIAAFFIHDSLHMVVVPQFRVTGDQGVLRVAEKSASSRIMFSTPRPADAAQESFNIIRGSQNGEVIDVNYTWVSPEAGWVNPTTRKPDAGTFRTYTSGTLLAPAKAGSYLYNLAYAGPPGIIPSQHFSTGPLATVTERYYQDAPQPLPSWVTFSGPAAFLGESPALVYAVSMPSVQTQYFTAAPDTYWENETFTASGFAWARGYSDDPVTYQPGEHTYQDWNRFPLHGGLDTVVRGGIPALPVLSSAARLGDKLELHQVPWSDNQFGHLGLGFAGYLPATGSYVIHQNGHRIARGNAVHGIPLVKLSSEPARVTYTLRVNRPVTRAELSPSSTTTWSWRTRRDLSARVPQAWYCEVSDSHQLVRRCAVQPLLTLQYLVRGEALNGRTAPGQQKITLNVGHIQLGGSAAITGATAQVSVNRGGTWTPATVTGQAGHYTITFTAPAGGAVSLKVHATDAHGGSITETLIRAYGVRK